MDSEIAEQILEELVPTFQRLETESEAVLQFLKAKGMADDEELAPYLERAANASSVRWRAIRVRMARLLTSAENSDGKKQAKPKAEEPAAAEPEKAATENAGRDAPHDKDRVQGPEKKTEQGAEKRSVTEATETAKNEPEVAGKGADQHPRNTNQQVSSKAQDRNVKPENEHDDAESDAQGTAPKKTGQGDQRKTEARQTEPKPAAPISSTRKKTEHTAVPGRKTGT